MITHDDEEQKEAGGCEGESGSQGKSREGGIKQKGGSEVSYPGGGEGRGATSSPPPSIDAGERAVTFLNLPAAIRSKENLEAMFADAADQARRHGERWAEIAIAAWLSEVLPGVVGGTLAMVFAEKIRSREWRRPEFQSSVDLEAEAREGLALANVSRETSGDD